MAIGPSCPGSKPAAEELVGAKATAERSEAQGVWGTPKGPPAGGLGGRAPQGRIWDSSGEAGPSGEARRGAKRPKRGGPAKLDGSHNGPKNEVHYGHFLVIWEFFRHFEASLLREISGDFNGEKCLKIRIFL